MKRANGTGSITKLKKKLRKPFLVRVVKDGKRKVLGYYESKREANKALDEYVANPFDVDGATLTFKELYNLFLKTKAGTVENETYRTYSFKFKHCESIKNYLLKNIKTPVLQEIFNKSALSSGSKREIKSFLVMLFEFAVQMEYVPVNRAKGIKLGKHRPKKEKKLFTQQEIRKIWQHKDLFICKVVLIMIYTGTRVGEVVNIKKENIDLVNGVIRDFGNKTAKSKNRFLPIHKDIEPILRELYEKTPTDYILFVEDKKHRKGNYPVHKETIRRNFKELMKSLGMEHTTHDARITFASTLNKSGVNDTVITDLMGHSDFKTTKNYYIINDEETIKDTIENLDILQ